MTRFIEVAGLSAFYGDAQALFDIDLHIDHGEVVALLGRNGMGKTTTVRSIMGLVKPRHGRISIDGVNHTGAAPFRVARAGLGLVPEGRQIFPTLTVRENLVATARKQAGGWQIEKVFSFFPRLAERQSNRGNELSGGEQQMLAIGRALMTNPKLLILDEATEGLAPLIREDIWNCLARLRGEGLSILVIDKNIDALIRLADRHVILEKGHVVWHGTSGELARDKTVRENYLHL